VVGFSRLNPFARIPGLTLGPVTMSGSKVAMESPRLTGFRKDSQPYEVTATAAYQDIRKPTVIELKSMRARLAIDDAGTMARLSSAMGIFDTSKEQLELSEDIRITTDRGEEVLLKSASVDFKAGTVVSRDPVRITLSAGTVEAEGLQVTDGGRTISFTGRVRTRLDAGGQAPDPGAKAALVAQPKIAQPQVSGPEASMPAPGRGASSPPPRVTQRASPNERKP
jgi:lipopolysaccharide export system protein LptC